MCPRSYLLRYPLLVESDAIRILFSSKQHAFRVLRAHDELAKRHRLETYYVVSMSVSEQMKMGGMVISLSGSGERVDPNGRVRRDVSLVGCSRRHIHRE
jgi:hypothetical protein